MCVCDACDKVTSRLILQMDYICASQTGWYTAALVADSGIIATTTTTTTTKPTTVKAIKIINTADTVSAIKRFNSSLAGNVHMLNCF